jgi:hypothetical protein
MLDRAKPPLIVTCADAPAARALGVSVEYLVSGQKPRHEEIVILSNPRIRAMLKIFNGLNEESQDIIVGIAQVLKRHKAHTGQ